MTSLRGAILVASSLFSGQDGPAQLDALKPVPVERFYVRAEADPPDSVPPPPDPKTKKELDKKYDEVVRRSLEEQLRPRREAETRRLQIEKLIRTPPLTEVKDIEVLNGYSLAKNSPMLLKQWVQLIEPHVRKAEKMLQRAKLDLADLSGFPAFGQTCLLLSGNRLVWSDPRESNDRGITLADVRSIKDLWHNRKLVAVKNDRVPWGSSQSIALKEMQTVAQRYLGPVMANFVAEEGDPTCKDLCSAISKFNCAYGKYEQATKAKDTPHVVAHLCDEVIKSGAEVDAKLQAAQRLIKTDPPLFGPMKLSEVTGCLKLYGHCFALACLGSEPDESGGVKGLSRDQVDEAMERLKHADQWRQFTRVRIHCYEIDRELRRLAAHEIEHNPGCLQVPRETMAKLIKGGRFPLQPFKIDSRTGFILPK